MCADVSMETDNVERCKVFSVFPVWMRMRSLNATVTPSHKSHVKQFSQNWVGCGYFVALTGSTSYSFFFFFFWPKITLHASYTWRPLGRGQDAESNLVNPHSFRNLSAYSWLIPRTLLQSIHREQWFAHFSASDADRMPKWHNLLPQPFLILSAL